MTHPVAAGPWEQCPRCDAEVGWGRFVPSDDEPGVLVGVCPGCGERVTVVQP